jgi:hypothetical protein
MAERGPEGGFLVDFQPMSFEEMQRAMQFLLDQQAQFAADVARNEVLFAEQDKRLGERLDQLSTRTDQIAVGLLGLTSVAGELISSQQRSDQRINDLGEYIRSVESQLLTMFDRHLREDHGHRPS